MSGVGTHRPLRYSTLAAWSSELPAACLAGSLYAVPAAERSMSARALHDAGHGVHLDVIIDADGQHVGVTAAEVRDVRADLSDAVIDLHLILLGENHRSTVERARLTTQGIELAREVRATCLTLPRAALALETAVQGIDLALWQQLSPNEPTDLLAPATGGLLMLITPGTTDQADPSRLALIPALTELGYPIGVDGGVTHALALRAHELGATRIVSGRALLRAGPPLENPLPDHP